MKKVAASCGEYDPKRLKNFENIRKIAVIAEDIDACLILYESPVSSAYLENFLKKRPDLSGWKFFLRKFVSDNNDRLCIYFLQDLWTNENSINMLYYEDQDHLNKRGAEVFTLLLQEKLTGLATVNRAGPTAVSPGK